MKTCVRSRWLVALAVLVALLVTPAQAADDQPLSAETILKLKSVELSDAEIGAMIVKRGVNFQFNGDVAIKLIEAGCSTELVKLIKEACLKAENFAADQAAAPQPSPPIAPKTNPLRPDGDEDGLMGNDPAPPPTPKSTPPPADDDDPLPAPNKPADNDDDPLPPPTPKTPATAEKKPEPDAKPQTKNPFGKRVNPIDELDKTTEPSANVMYGPRVTDDKQNGLEAGYKGILQDSTLPLEVTTTKHFTVMATKANAAKYLPDIKLLEEKLEQRFPGTIKKGPDKRSAIIVLVDTQDDFKKWITAEFTKLGLDKAGGADGQGANPLLMALNARGHYFPWRGVNDLSAPPTDLDRKKAVAYSVGYLYMYALTEGGAPDCFITGFGNYCESLMYTDPMSLVYSYEERQIAPSAQMTWINKVKDQMQKKTITDSDGILAFSTVTMKSVNYAEAWSLISYLATRPREFEGVVNALRDRNGAMKAIQAYYKLDNKNLNYQWQVWANAQN